MTDSKEKQELINQALDVLEERFRSIRNCFKEYLNLAWDDSVKQGEHDKINSLADELLKRLIDKPDYISEPCKKCSNHPSNGGSGICNCILGGYQTKC